MRLQHELDFEWRFILAKAGKSLADGEIIKPYVIEVVYVMKS
jgi:hypothetical protein